MTTISTPRAEVAAIRTALTVLVEPSGVVEVRIPDAGRAGVVSGYYDDLDLLAQDAARLNQQRGTTYITLNPPNSALLARAANRAREHAKVTTSDHDILCRRWFLIDTDPKRPAGISATADEHEAALQRAAEIQEFLTAMGWPDPVSADSGNGGHLLYSVKLPNDAASTSLLKACLAALAFRFSDVAVDIDQSTFNASRVVKLYGTVAGKGDSIPDRPHRLAQLHSVPANLVSVPIDRLQELASLAPPEAKTERRAGHGDGSAFDVESWLSTHGIAVAKTGPWQDGRKWILRECAWNPDHQDGAAYAVQFASGALAAGCHHNGCAGKTWHDLRGRFEPDYTRSDGDAERTTEPRGSAPSGCPPNVWPEPPGPAAFRGLAGRIVAAVTPYTEADPIAVLVNVLAAFGNAAGAGPHRNVGATRHTARLFGVLIGRSSKARKGDSWQPVRAICELVAPDWAGRVLGGLASGEGLIRAVRDPIEKLKSVKVNGHVEQQRVVDDEGVADKRLLCIEPEFGRVLSVMGRQGNTLSHLIRDAWDSGNLRSMTKNAPTQATGAHIALLGHITVEELRRELTDVVVANGFANRFIWFLVRRSRSLPNPPAFTGALVRELGTELARTLATARTIDEVRRDAAADALWCEVYEELAAEREDLAGAVLARGEAQVTRLALVYALLDGSPPCRTFSGVAAMDG